MAVAGESGVGGAVEPISAAPAAAAGTLRPGRGWRDLAAAAGVCVVLVWAGVAAAAAVRIHAPASVRIAGPAIHVTAGGLRPGRYALTLAAAPAPTRLTVCVARLATSARRSTSVSFSVRIPSRLRCYENDSVGLGSVKTSPGSYHLIVGVPDGPSGFALGASFVRVPIRLTR
jgi:hypothetical protein